MLAILVSIAILAVPSLSQVYYAKLTKYLADPTCSDESAQMQIIYFSNQCLIPSGVSIKRACDKDDNGDWTFLDINCAYNASLPESGQCAENCVDRTSTVTLGECRVYNTSDYGSTLFYDKYECIEEMDVWESADVFTDWQVYDVADTSCSGDMIYREVIPSVYTEPNHCIKNAGRDRRYLYYCETQNDIDTITVVNNFGTDGVCPDDVSGGIIYNGNSVCSAIGDNSTWYATYNGIGECGDGTTAGPTSNPTASPGSGGDETSGAFDLGVIYQLFFMAACHALLFCLFE